MEEKKEVVSQKKKNNSMIIIVSILVIALLGAVGYICYDKLVVNKVVEADKTDKKDNKDTVSTDSNEVEDTNTNLPEGCVNKPDHTYNVMSGSADNFIGLTGSVSADGKTVTINVDNGKFYNAVSYLTNPQGGAYSTNSFSITYVSNETIKAVKFAGFGQAITGNEYILLITQSGKVKSMPILNKKTDAHGNNYATSNIIEGATLTFTDIPNLSGIVNIEQASVNAPMSSGFATAIAYVNDKTFYDLSEYLVK